MSGFTLYLIEVLPGLSRIIGVAGFFALCAAVACAINAAGMQRPVPKEADYETGAYSVALERWTKLQQEIKATHRIAWVLVGLGILMLTCYALVPSREGFYRIYLLQWATNSSTVTQLPEKLQEYLDVLIENARK